MIGRQKPFQHNLSVVGESFCHPLFQGTVFYYVLLALLLESTLSAPCGNTVKMLVARFTAKISPLVTTSWIVVELNSLLDGIIFMYGSSL